MRKILTFLSIFILFGSNIFSQDTSWLEIDGMPFVSIPAGSFIYGRFNPPYPLQTQGEYKGFRDVDYELAARLAKEHSMPGFTVNVGAFAIGKFEVTQRHWQRIMGQNPSRFKGDNNPVENITWKDVQEFIAKLNASNRSYRFRLPTEFEWEYAARAGAAEDISWSSIRKQAHLGTQRTQEVGKKKPNAWGLYDMLGNVWEWTSTVYNERIFADSIPSQKGSQYVIKGASFTGDVKNATYMTHAAGPANGWDVGLRLVAEKITHAKFSQLQQVTTHQSSGPITGWHLSRTSHQGTTPIVRLKDGVMSLEQFPFGQGGVLLTDRKYSDFELSADVKIDSFCNGGIFLRSTESGQAYQVELSEPGGTGNLLGEVMKVSKPAKADKKKAKWRPNQWNNFRIRMVGRVPRITLWINGVKMWDVQQPVNDFTAGAVEGMIGLQVHWSATYSGAAEAFDMSGSWRPGGKHYFRNIKIREL